MPVGTEENHETVIIVADILAEIWNQDLPRTNLI
jgi:hypothetical protein